MEDGERTRPTGTRLQFCAERQKDVGRLGLVGFRGVGAEESESAFLQDVDGRGVVLCDAGVKRPDLFQPKESSDGFGSDAAAPESTIEPVPDLAFPIGGPAPNVPTT